MKKLACVLVALMLVSSIVGCSGGATKLTEVGFVTDVGGIDDKSFNQSSWEGVVKYAQEKGWKEGSEYGYIQSSGEADYVPNLTTVAESGAKGVLCAGYMFEGALKKLAPKYPDVMFSVADTVVEGDNILSATFAANEGSYLVGVIAGMRTKTNKVGFLGGMESDTIIEFEVGFAAGVKAANPKAEVVVQYSGSFSDAQAGQATAVALYDQGCDIIFACAGGSGNGAIAEAKSRKENNGEEVWVIGVDRDQYEDGKCSDGSSIILTSMMKRVDVWAYETAKAMSEGTFEAGHKTYTLKDGGVGIPDENPNLTEEEVQAANEYKDKIVAGKIKVPTKR